MTCATGVWNLPFTRQENENTGNNICLCVPPEACGWRVARVVRNTAQYKVGTYLKHYEIFCLFIICL